MIPALLKICPYCICKAERVPATELFGPTGKGHVWRCTKCDARVGAHDSGPLAGEPLGTLANAELRQARTALHDVFDPLWNGGGMKRGQAYRWLAEELQIDQDAAHIAMLDLEDCNRAIRAVKVLHFLANQRQQARQRPPSNEKKESNAAG